MEFKIHAACPKCTNRLVSVALESDKTDFGSSYTMVCDGCHTDVIVPEVQLSAFEMNALAAFDHVDAPIVAKEHLNDDDLFSLIPDEVAKLIAGMCSAKGRGECICIHVGNAYREATGKPQFRSHSEDRQEAVRTLEDCQREITCQRALIQDLSQYKFITERLLALFEAEPPRDKLQGQEEDLAWRAGNLALSLEKKP